MGRAITNVTTAHPDISGPEVGAYLCVITGLITILLGMIRLGILVDFIPGMSMFSLLHDFIHGLICVTRTCDCWLHDWISNHNQLGPMG